VLPLLLALAVLLTPLVATARPADAQSPSLKDLLRGAGAWVQRFADDGVFVVAEERYEQEYRVKDGPASRVERRSLLSEIVFVRTPEEETRAGYPWVQLRDVVEVDGTPLPDHRGRLERLFKEATSSAYAQASALIKESARFNIGPGIRTINVPSFALFFLHPRNQSRFRFQLGQVGRVGQVGGLGQAGHIADSPHQPYLPHPPDQPSVVVSYRERGRPTMILSPKHEDLPATGFFWIEPSTGRVLKTRMDVEVDRHWATMTEVTYGHDAGVNAWVPLTMHERAGARLAGGANGAGGSTAGRLADDDALDCTATYSNFRRFQTDARLIVPK
jgi:hypothetical protein